MQQCLVQLEHQLQDCYVNVTGQRKEIGAQRTVAEEKIYCSPFRGLLGENSGSSQG